MKPFSNESLAVFFRITEARNLRRLIIIYNEAGSDHSRASIISWSTCPAFANPFFTIASSPLLLRFGCKISFSQITILATVIPDEHMVTEVWNGHKCLIQAWRHSFFVENVMRTEQQRGGKGESPTPTTLIKRRHTRMWCTNEIMYGRLVGPSGEPECRGMVVPRHRYNLPTFYTSLFLSSTPSSSVARSTSWYKRQTGQV